MFFYKSLNKSLNGTNTRQIDFGERKFEYTHSNVLKRNFDKTIFRLRLLERFFLSINFKFLLID